MAFGYVTQAVLNRIAEKTASLVNAVKTIATNAETLAQTASAEAKFNGTCATAAATAAKVVVCAEYTQLSVGSRITVKFTYANTAAQPLSMSTPPVLNLSYGVDRHRWLHRGLLGRHVSLLTMEPIGCCLRQLPMLLGLTFLVPTPSLKGWYWCHYCGSSFDKPRRRC